MSESETDYFLIEGGTAKELFDAWNKVRVVQTKKRLAFLKKHKCGKSFFSGRDSEVLGLIFDKEPDLDVWKRSAKGSHWVPRRITPEGKALYKEMHSLGDPCFTDMTQSIVGVGHIFWGMRAYYGGLDWLDHKPVLLMPNPFGDKPRPKTVDTKNHWSLGYELKLVDGVRALKRSEYWRMQEAKSNASLERKLKAADANKIPRLRSKKAKA